MLTTNSSLLDGINRHILTVAPALNAIRDCEVAVCTANAPGGLNKALEAVGVKTYSLGASHGHDLKIFRKFHKVMKDFRPDIVHSHVMALYERMLLSTMFRKVKHVSTIHGIPDKVEHETTRMKLEQLFNRIFSIKHSAICYISEGVRDVMSSYHDNQTLTPVTYNPIRLSEKLAPCNELHNLLNIDKSTPVIGTSCRIANQKDPEQFTKVMSMILKNNPNVHAVVIGDGDKNIIDRCKSIVSEYDVHQRFHWLGFREDAPKLVAGMDCFIMTSIWEGLPTTLLECMASDTPFAFLRGNGGLKDIERLNEKEGPFCIIGDRENLNDFAGNISLMINDKESGKKYANNARGIAAKYFSIEKISNDLHNLYTQILETHE